MHKKIKLGITQGDINGISYELIIKIFQDNRILDFCTPIIYGSPKVAAYYRKALNIQNFNFNTIANTDEANSKKVNLINCLDDNVRVELGKETKQGVEAAIISLEQASEDLKNGKTDALITNPLSLDMAKQVYPNFKNNKTFLCKKFDNIDNMSLFINEGIRVGMVSEDIPFAEILSHINEKNIIKKLQTLNYSLQQDFKIQKPRIAVLSINPNANNHGARKEEKEIIIPAINKAKKDKNILAIGPFSADAFFSSDNINKFDAILAMYYDQGASMFKAINFGGISYFAGFPKIIIEPDYNLSYEIAGMGKAPETSKASLQETIYMAHKMFKNREMHKELTKNPLPLTNNTEVNQS